MILDLSRLGSKELKELSEIVKIERKRRGKKNPTNHAPPQWPIPKVAVVSQRPEAP